MEVILFIVFIPVGVLLIIKGKRWLTGKSIDVGAIADMGAKVKDGQGNVSGGGGGSLPIPGLKGLGLILIIVGVIGIILKILSAGAGA